MGKWIAGVAATVIGGVLVYWLTVGMQLPSKPMPTYPSPTPKISKGFLVLLKSSNISEVEDLRRGDKICTSKSGAEFLRTLSPFSALDLLVIPAGEIYGALTRGVCSSAFVFQRESADKLFPVGITGMRLIPVYIQ